MTEKDQATMLAVLRVPENIATINAYYKKRGFRRPWNYPREHQLSIMRKLGLTTK